MDSYRSSTNEGLTFLAECVSDQMTACEAADATHSCWTEAEKALAPVIGRDGLEILLRQGEAVAVRQLGERAPPSMRASINDFCEWVRSLATKDALSVCKALLASVETRLLSLVGPAVLRRLLGQRGHPC